MVILEAFACGTGVIATDCGGPRELITNSVNGFLTPNRDEEALSEAMLRMAVDPAEAARIGKNARQIAENEYSLEAFGKRIDGAYRQFL